MPPTDLALAHRIARRHQGTVVFKEQNEAVHSDGDVVTSADVARLLWVNRAVAVVIKFCSPLKGSSNTVTWEGVDSESKPMSGTVTLHAAIRSETEIVSYAEVIVHEDEPSISFSAL